MINIYIGEKYRWKHEKNNSQISMYIIINNGGFYMKKCLTIIVFVCLALLCGCSKVNSLISDIDNLSMSNVSQEKVDDIVERYNALSDKEKKKITNYSIIEKYENVNDIISDIDNLSTSDIGQEEIDDLFERYNALSNEEKEKICGRGTFV